VTVESAVQRDPIGRENCLSQYHGSSNVLCVWWKKKIVEFNMNVGIKNRTKGVYYH
jgi:hypothetical protein